MTISRDEVERARLMSEYKYELDTQSRVAYARKEGRKEGILEIAMKMKSRNIPLGQIADYTGLSYDEIAKL
jgi:predicted transposase/invertase (TIGR01784 family)